MAERLEGELGDEQPSFIEGCPDQWYKLPEQAALLTVSLDGGYVKALQLLEWLELDVDAQASPEAGKLARTLYEFDHYIRTNQSSIPNSSPWPGTHL
jgi:hypothetical protein